MTREGRAFNVLVFVYLAALLLPVLMLLNPELIPSSMVGVMLYLEALVNYILLWCLAVFLVAETSGNRSQRSAAYLWGAVLLGMLFSIRVVLEHYRISGGYPLVQSYVYVCVSLWVLYGRWLMVWYRNRH